MRQSKVGIMLVGFLTAILLIGCTNNIKVGIEYLEEENYEAAADSFAKDIADKKNLEEAYRGLGIAKYEVGDFEAAVSALESALKHETEETATIFNMIAASYLQMDSYEEALKYYEKALQMEDCTEEMKQEILFNQIAIYQELSDWEVLKEKVSVYMEKYPEDDRMNKTAEFLETR